MFSDERGDYPAAAPRARETARGPRPSLSAGGGPKTGSGSATVSMPLVMLLLKEPGDVLELLCDRRAQPPREANRSKWHGRLEFEQREPRISS